MSNRTHLHDFAVLVYVAPNRHTWPVCIGPKLVEQLDEDWREEFHMDPKHGAPPGLWVITGRQRYAHGGYPEVALGDGGGEVDVYYEDQVWRRPTAAELMRLRKGEPLVVPDVALPTASESPLPRPPDGDFAEGALVVIRWPRVFEDQTNDGLVCTIVQVASREDGDVYYDLCAGEKDLRVVGECLYPAPTSAREGEVLPPPRAD